jgi:hypothetical protein
MKKELSKINSMPASKDELKLFIQNVKTDILSGNHNPLKIAVMLKSMEEIVKELRGDEEIKRIIEDEAAKYTEKTFNFENFQITKTGRSSKDFSVCNDKVYDDLVIELNKTKEMIKAREKMLETGINPETGEVFQKPLVSYQNIISITIK